MSQTISRSRCLYGDEIIGIESIYEVIDGKQINKANEVERVRKLGRENQLFCPCGCGANLILVAGEKNLVRQHFRSRGDSNSEGLEKECTWKDESELSIQSKITLKCWLESKMDPKEAGFKYSVRATNISKNGKKFELSLYSPANDFGIVYAKDKRGIYDEKLNYLNEFLDTKILYVTDINNHIENGQYPEFMKKMQNKQGFCAFLKFESKTENEYKYEDAYLRTVFYRQNSRGLWVSHDLTSEKLDKYSFDENHDLSLNGESVTSILDKKIKALEEAEAKASAEKKARDEREEAEKKEREARAIAEADERAKQEREKREAEIARRKEWEKRQEEARFRREEEEKFRFEAIQRQKLQEQLEMDRFNSAIPLEIPNYVHPDPVMAARGVTSKVYNVGNLIRKNGYKISGYFSYWTNEYDMSMFKREKMDVVIGSIFLYPRLIQICEKYTNRLFCIFINEMPVDQDMSANQGIAYCNLSLKYTPMEDINRVLKQQFDFR